MANQDASSDTPVDLKKRARRRLVGASALALLAVIVLPMVIDHEPKPASQDIQIRIPGQESDGLAPHAAAGKSAALSPATTVPPTPDIATGMPDDKLQEIGKIEPKQPAPVVVKPQQDAAKSDAGAALVAKPNEKAAPDKTPPRSLEESHAAAVLDGADEQWLVRLGAYQNAANVKLLLAKVKEAGIAAYAEKFDSPKGPRTRVLAGPFNSREAAEKAQARIKKLGVDGAVAAKQ